jgi:hypothetical protein
MNSSAASDPRLASFPGPLRELLDAELTAGNTIVEIASCFPAPPAGAYVKLARPVSTRPRATNDGLVFYDRNSSLYSGEWTDAKRFHFLLEPSRPPEPEPDMDAIRRAHTPPAAPLLAGPVADPTPSYSSSHHTPQVHVSATVAAHLMPNSCLRRFEASMVINYEKWHDGVGYDLAILKEANPAELALIEDLLIRRRAADWRDVEALAAIGSERAKGELRRALGAGNAEIRGAVVQHAPDLVSESTKVEHLVEALRTAEFYHGLSQALAEAARFHPPDVITQLFRSALTREGGVAAHCAGLLLFIHGQAEAPFDWSHRPFLLRFNTKNAAEREAVFRELCEKLGVNPAD